MKNYDSEIATNIEKLSNMLVEQHNFAFTTGYFQSFIDSLKYELPEKYQKVLLDKINSSIIYHAGV